MAHKILIIEDTSINLTLLTILFKKHGYEVQGASDGKEGLKLAKVMSYDIILCDLQMAGIEGTKLIPILKADERLKDVPIVVVSGHTLEEMRINKDLVTAYFAKPIQPGILIEKIQEILPPVSEESEESKTKIDQIEKRAAQRKSSSMLVVEGFPVEPITVNELKAGMVTGDEVLDNNNLSVISLGVTLTDKYIEKLKSLDIEKIFIRK